MIDVHTHIFNFKYVPDGYFQKFCVRRKDAGKVTIFLDSLSPGLTAEERQKITEKNPRKFLW